MSLPHLFDACIIGAGVSGHVWAKKLIGEGLNCLMIEAGKHYGPKTYPRTELQASAELFWSGGIEFNDDVDLGLLRAKCVGGGSVINGALLGEFDEEAFQSFREVSEIPFFKKENFNQYYDEIRNEIKINEISSECQNKNAKIFIEGCDKNNYQWAPLERAQATKNCYYDQGNDSIECLYGCELSCKQSLSEVMLKSLLEKNLKLKSEFQVDFIEKKSQGYFNIWGIDKISKKKICYQSRKIILAASSIGNTLLLLKSGFKTRIKNLGENFFTHPQFMILGVYPFQLNSFKGAMQSVKSDDPNFRKLGFKLENVFAPPVSLAMLFPDRGINHMQRMKQISQMACIEVCVRDTTPGKILLKKNGSPKIIKKMGDEEIKRKKNGIEAIKNIFFKTGVSEIIEGNFGIGLHLMGGLSIGSNSSKSVVNQNFSLHEEKDIYVSDSSIFPSAPGINPSMTIMAISKMASQIFINEWIY